MEFPDDFEFYCIPYNKIINTKEDYVKSWLEVMPQIDVGVKNMTANGWVELDIVLQNTIGVDSLQLTVDSF